MTEEVTIKESGYDQKQFIQIRLHEIIQRYDRANINPLIYDYNFRCYNYNIMYQSLLSIYNTISSKLSPDEKKKGREQLEKLSEKMKLPIYSNKNGRQNLAGNNYEDIITCMFETRCLFEEQMDKHGFNPSKDDVSKSIIKF
jgi:hypothetical protein